MSVLAGTVETDSSRTCSGRTECGHMMRTRAWIMGESAQIPPTRDDDSHFEPDNCSQSFSVGIPCKTYEMLTSYLLRKISGPVRRVT